MTPPRRASGSAAASSALSVVHAAIVGCERCPRLREYCRTVAQEKRAAYRDWHYWGRPVPGFGDPRARMLVLGLAPAAHGANRTGRVFTGDGVGGSGDFLMAALHRAGYANIPTSQHADDGLTLRDAYITAAVRCAPPQNKPTPAEVATCLGHLEAEVRALPNLQVVVALGKIAWDGWLQFVARRGPLPSPRPRFAHGATWTPGTPASQPSGDARGAGVGGSARSARTSVPASPDAAVLIGCYHPSRQNTNTGTVTPAMYDEIFQRLVRQQA